MVPTKTIMQCDEFDPAAGAIPELSSIDAFHDDRGYFNVAWSRKFSVLGRIAQVNHSYSQQNTLRGMHWQVPPYAVGKYVKCIRGKIKDVLVDLRRSSQTFGHWKAYTLCDASNCSFSEALWVPPGFAHGFLAESPEVDVMYLQTGEYKPSAERSLLFNDPTVGIKWSTTMADDQFIISDKDRNASLLLELTEDDLFA